MKLTTSAREEILVLLSTGKAFYRQDKLGALVLGEQMANQGVKIRLLTPSSDWVKQRAQELARYIELRYIPEELQTQLSIFIYDRKSSLIVETKDDSADSAYEAAGFVTYSNSPSTVSSYLSIFETLWKQSGMYEESQNQLHSAEDELDRTKQYLNEVLKEVASFKKNC
jgi:two-component system, OmpR family, sensor histidine kinase VicK